MQEKTKDLDDLAKAAVAKKNYQESLKNFEQILHVDEDNFMKHATVLFNMSLVYSKMGDKVSQMAQLNKCLALNPKFMKALNQRGDLHMDNEKYSEAVKDYSLALKQNPCEKNKEIIV